MADTTKTKVEELRELISNHVDTVTGNPHQVTNLQIPELDKVENTSDLDKPVSIRTQIELDKKISVGDIEDNLEKDKEGVDLKHKPMAAHWGMAISDKVKTLDPENWDSQIEDIENRLAPIEKEQWTD